MTYTMIFTYENGEAEVVGPFEDLEYAELFAQASVAVQCGPNTEVLIRPTHPEDMFNDSPKSEVQLNEVINIWKNAKSNVYVALPVE